MSHVFISYNQEDSDFAFVLKTHIEKARFDTWMARDRLTPGADWSEAIDKGIREAIAMVVVMSPVAKASEYVTYEWSFAVGAGIPVIPVLYKDTVLHPRLARFQYLQFTSPSVRPWEELVAEIKEIDRRRSVLLDDTIPAYIKHAIAALDSSNSDDRRGAVRTLGSVSKKEGNAKNALFAALDHPLLDVRVFASLQLISNAQSTADSRIVVALADNFDLRPPCVDGLDVGRELIRAGAAELDLMVASLQSSSTPLRLAAICGLGEVGDRATKHLVPLLSDRAVRTRTAEALGQIRDKSATPDLIRVLDEPYDPLLITAAVRSLVSLGAHASVARIITILHDMRSLPRLDKEDRIVVNNLTLAVFTLGLCPDTEEALIAELRNLHSDEIEAGLAAALGQSKSSRAFDALRSLLRAVSVGIDSGFPRGAERRSLGGRIGFWDAP